MRKDPRNLFKLFDQGFWHNQYPYLVLLPFFEKQ